MYHILCVLGLTFLFSSCGWQEAKEVIATADSLDQAEHVIYDDTAALGKAIRCLDNPFGRVLMSNTLGKAYYYMGRNLEDCYMQVADAAKCYLEADRLQINNPIYRGRVNVCMGYICKQNRNDSLALIYYNRANVHFNGTTEWYYAQTLLDKSELNVKLSRFIVADSILQIAQSYQLDSAYQARYYETRGLYFYEQQQYDSALVYLKQGLDYWQNEQDRHFSYLTIMQICLKVNDQVQAIPYAQIIVNESTNPNYLVNAYYCLMQDAKCKNNVELLSKYSHARTDAQRLLLNDSNNFAEAIPILEEYVQNPHPLRWVWIVLCVFVVLCITLIICIIIYRKRAVARINVSDEQIVSLSTQIQEQQDELQKQSELHHYDKRLKSIRRKYPKPVNRWNDYDILKKEIQPYLYNWMVALDKLDLTNRDKVFCVLSFIYPQMAMEDLASCLCITKETLIVRKNRIAKKLGVSSAKLGDFLHKICQ